MGEPEPELNDHQNPRLFASGGKRDLVMILAVLCVFAYAVFGWVGVGVVLSIPLGFALLFGLAFLVVALSIWGATRDITEDPDDK